MSKWVQSCSWLCELQFVSSGTISTHVRPGLLLSDMSMRRTLVACTAVVLLTVIGSGSVSADESVPVPTTIDMIMVEQFDEESGLIWSKVDDNTIDVSLPD